MRLDALATDGARLDTLVASRAQGLATAHRDVAAGLVLHDLVWRVTAPPLATAVVSGIAPRLRAEGITLVHDASGACTGVHLHGLDAEVDADLDRLLRRVRDDVVGTIEGLLPAFRSRARLGMPALWGEVADTFAAALQWLGDLVGAPRAARDAADTLLDGTPPLRGGTNWVPVTVAGASATHRVRNTCCRAYRLEQYDYCAGCPLLDAEDRLARFRAITEASADAAAGGTADATSC